MEETTARDLFAVLRERLPGDAAFVLVVIPQGGDGGDVISNIVGGESVADVLRAVAEEQTRGGFFDEVRE